MRQKGRANFVIAQYIYLVPLKPPVTPVKTE